MFGTTHEDLVDCNPTATAFPAGQPFAGCETAQSPPALTVAPCALVSSLCQCAPVMLYLTVYAAGQLAGMLALGLTPMTMQATS